ncbi:MAG TPA: NAD-dependent epimerase/dehydratase family protein, partial [Candidatus Wunengus sp. YC61]|uniref:NAD-dependent epimerase/dehydratase family protein n=1 Tax=Candidatus Wunengus sp. YC61 TaxID=3367698 RepID=UPI004027F745
MFKGKNVLVAGGTGFIGVNLINCLLSLGASVRATLHKRDEVVVDKRIEYIKADLLVMDDCKRVVKDMDYVFMCAANTAGAAVMASTPLVHVTPNIIMNSQMLEAAYFAKVKKFVWLSSNAAYPPTGDRPVKEDEMFDGDPYDTYFGVGWMKRYTEILCKLYSEKLKDRMVTVVLRPSNIYGPYDKFDFATSHMMAATIRKVVERQKPIKVWGTGDDVRDLIYIDDFIDAMILAAEKIETFDPVNIGYGKGYSIKEILQICLEVDGYANAIVEYDPTKPSMIPVRLISTEKTEKMLGFKACTDLKEGIRKTMEWYRKNHCKLK